MMGCWPLAMHSRRFTVVGVGATRVHVWHEAADTRLFRPPAIEGKREGLVWIGNWGDDERSAELERFLFRPAQTVGLSLDVYGVRYPDAARDMLVRFGARYRGWLPNARAPRSSRATSQPFMCHAAIMSTCFQASRPSGCSRRSLAEFRWSRLLGTIARACFAREPIIWWPGTRARWSAISMRFATIPTCARLLSEMGCRPFTAVIPVRTAWTN